MNKILSKSAVVFISTLAGCVSAQPCDCEALAESVRLLERRVEMLEHRLHLEQAQEASPQTASAPEIKALKRAPAVVEPASQGQPVPVVPSATPVLPRRSTPATVARGAEPAQVAADLMTGMAQARFYLFHDAGNMQPTREPDAAGLVPFEGKVSFHPRDYGFEAGGLFSTYDDPSLIPAVAVSLTGWWRIEQPGTYRLIARPKPTREGGSAVRSTLSFSLLIDGQAVIPETRTQAWRKVEKVLELPVGLHQVEIHALAQSPGFGPSPTTSRLVLEMRGPREAAPRPLRLSVP